MSAEKTVEKNLKCKGFYEGNVDNDFGNRTFRAVLQFQTASVGPEADDAFVGSR